MRNLAIAILSGIAAFALLYPTGLLKLGEAIVPSILVLVATYYVFARRTFKKMEKVFLAATQAMQSMPPKIDLAIKTLEGAYAFAPHQFGVRSQVDAQIGVMYFLQKQFSKAAPYLQRSLAFAHWIAPAMLAVVQYKKKNHDDMRKTLRVVTKRGKKNGLAWNLSAYLLMQVGDRDAAQETLVRAVKATQDDPKVKEALLAVQNGKKMKMRTYKEQWYQFHLERPPMQMQQQVIPGKVSKAARRGRW